MRAAYTSRAGVIWKRESGEVIAPLLEPAQEAPIDSPVKKARRSDARRQFLKSPEWRALRATVLAEMGSVCVKCGSTEQVQVDHIFPRSKFPELALERTNLRPLCWPCNKSKNTKIESVDDPE
jgi:5-methylcytosine-specific restriction endonuclease McrA